MTSGSSPALPRGKVIFAVDATGSRAETWAIARDLQAQNCCFMAATDAVPPSGHRAANSSPS
jgi:hypothetical protein